MTCRSPSLRTAAVAASLIAAFAMLAPNAASAQKRPHEGHWVLKPQNSQLWYKTVSAWCDRWTHTNGAGN